jgi:choline kinase
LIFTNDARPFQIPSLQQDSLRQDVDINRMIAIILVAGIGSRLQPITNDIPKCLVPVDGTPILRRALTLLLESGVSEVILVTGYCAQLVADAVSKWDMSDRVRSVWNPQFNIKGSAQSWLIGLRALPVGAGHLLLEGDIVFRPELLGQIDVKAGNVTLVEAYREGLDGSMLELGPEGQVLSWLHTSQQPNVRDHLYKSVNISYFDAGSTARLIRDMPSLMHRSLAHPVHVEHAISALLTLRVLELTAAKVSAFSWAEVDNEADLQIANRFAHEQLRGQ